MMDIRESQGELRKVMNNKRNFKIEKKGWNNYRIPNLGRP